MSEVKRYTGQLLDTFPHDAPNEDTAYVLASDYDALDADLNECIKDRDDAYARVDAMAKDAARCLALEAAARLVHALCEGDYPADSQRGIALDDLRIALADEENHE